MTSTDLVKLGAITATLALYAGMFFVLRWRSRALSVRTDYASILDASAGFPGSEFQTTRDGATDVFLDADQWLALASHRELALTWIAGALREWREGGHRVDGLAFIDKDSGPVGMVALQHQLASALGMPTCVVRMRRWPFLPQAAVKGSIPKKGDVFVLVSDVATTGGHLGRAAEVLRHDLWGVDVELALVLLNRSGDGVVAEMQRSSFIQLRSMPLVQEQFEETKQKKRQVGADREGAQPNA